MDEQTLHLRPPLWLPIAVALVAGGLYVVGKIVEVRGYQPVTIAVLGEGEVAAAPDVAVLSFGVQTGRQKTAKLAMDRLSRDMGAIMEAVKKSGVEEKDIRTESLWLNPAYDWEDGRQVDRGFEASQSLSVKVRDLGKISDVLAAATSVGANQVGGVTFTIDNPEKLRAQAREEAIAQAQEKAQTLASQLKKRLGELKGFSEGGIATPVPYMARMMELGVGGGGMEAPPLPGGEQEIRVQVTLTYELR